MNIHSPCIVTKCVCSPRKAISLPRGLPTKLENKAGGKSKASRLRLPSSRCRTGQNTENEIKSICMCFVSGAENSLGGFALRMDLSSLMF